MSAAEKPQAEGLRADARWLKPRADLFRDAAIASIESRALAYLRAGVAVHFRGPAGAGKTTLAMQLAAALDRPTVTIAGDGWFTGANLVGEAVGERTKRVHDRFIHNVTKTESATSKLWEDRALTVAMEEGYTLVYDEFTRSPPEANNPLLAALEEGVLVLSTPGRERRVIEAHPEFRAIFTSNPAEYAAVKAPQDALLDRMITFDLSYFDAETELGVVAARSRLAPEHCRPIVMLVRALRAAAQADGVLMGRAAPPSMRTAILIARIAADQGLRPNCADERFVQLCFDALESRAPSDRDDVASVADARSKFFERLRAAIREHCPAPPTEKAA
ncbi:MAG: gas vesicle protein GvpN [Pseudomonadota bacterium]